MFDGFESRCSFDQLLTWSEERESGHAEDFSGSAAEQNLFGCHLVGTRNSFRQCVVCHARITVRASERRLYDIGHFRRWAIRIFIAVQADQAVILLESRGLEYGG